ncbi:hypothetical protein BKA80DRAFT_305901 [Phyllosticta citrichinensis]
MVEVNSVPPRKGQFSILEDGNLDFRYSFRLRSYQTEMVEESLKQNIIVTMDTGSGKTHIAITRTDTELQSCDPDKLVWFLAPTVPLCDQQARLFERCLPAYQLRFLSGKDNVDSWSNQGIWDAVLKETRIVVSTPQILHDALSHGFVKMSKIALLIFDEAHMCRGRHPASKIMQDFYHSNRLHDEQTSLPHILGLTATPVVSASCKDLGVIEKSLNALAMAPKIHRTELIQYTHKPVLVQLSYEASESHPEETPPILLDLSRAYYGYDIEQDPYIISLRQRSLEETGHAQEKTFHELTELLQNRKTYVHDQLKRLYLHALNIFNELGAAATDFYVRSVIEKFGNYASTMRMMFADWSDEEGKVLKNIFSELNSCPRDQTERIPRKMEALIQFLVSEARPDFTCIVFVTQRATVVAMQFLLANHPQTRELFSIGTFVGMSSIAGKRKSNLALFDLASLKQQEETLDDFRTGKKNLIISTSVLEEGIDISTCNTVICFDAPPNMKSFVQRRGRARKQDSKYVIILSNDSPLVKSPENWTRLEEEMQAVYQNHLREIEHAEVQEQQDEEAHLEYRVESTGATLNLDNCVQHLYHLCTLLGYKTIHMDPRPEFSFKQNDSGLIIASVDLPAVVDAKLQHHESEGAWKTERFARKAAAFQAYKALHQSGLVNDNLLPLTAYSDHDPFIDADKNPFTDTPSLLQIPERVDPWVPIAADMIQNSGEKKWSRVKISLKLEEEDFEIVMSLPAPVVAPPSELNVYWNTGETHALRLEVLEPVTYTAEAVEALQASTYALFSSAAIQVEEPKNPVVLCERWKTPIPKEGRAFTCAKVPAEYVHQVLSNQGKPTIGLVSLRNEPMSLRYRFKGFFETQGTLNMELTPCPNPKGLMLFSKNTHNVVRVRKIVSKPASECLVDSIQLGYSILARCLPPVLHQIELLMVADQLCKTTLAEIRYNDPKLVLRAISASGAMMLDYERLENLGDSILKFITCLNVHAEHLRWPESYLARRKDKIVSNSVLTKASLNVGLDKFLVKAGFSSDKHWKLRSAFNIVANAKSRQNTGRKASSKLLADVVESLIGAAYVEGGMPKVLRCVKTLLPFYSWKSVDDRRSVLSCYAFSQAEQVGKPLHLEQLEELLGYKFNNPYLLLEAITHGSANSSFGIPTSSYQRLEFLGDSILDMLVSRRVYAFGKELSPGSMHSIKAAVVNEGILNFLVFECAQIRPFHRVRVDQETGEATVEEQGECKRTALWHWIRHSSPTLMQTFRESEAQHEETRSKVWEALQNDDVFPWKFFNPSEATSKVPSDVVEAILGAIFIDSAQNPAPSPTGAADAGTNADADDPSPLDGQAAGMSACEGFLERLGLLEILNRILRDSVNCGGQRERLLGCVPAALRDKFKFHAFFDEETGLWSSRILLHNRVLIQKDEVKAKSRGAAIREGADRALRKMKRAAAEGVKYRLVGRIATARDRAEPTSDFKESWSPELELRSSQTTQSQESSSSVYMSADEDLGERVELPDDDDDQTFYAADDGTDDLDLFDARAQERFEEEVGYERGENVAGVEEEIEEMVDIEMESKDVEGHEMVGQEVNDEPMDDQGLESEETEGQEQKGEQMEGVEVEGKDLESEKMDTEDVETEEMENVLLKKVVESTRHRVGGLALTRLIEEARKLRNMKTGAPFRVRGVKGHFVKENELGDFGIYVPPLPPSSPPPRQHPSHGEDQNSELDKSHADGCAQDVEKGSG